MARQRITSSFTFDEALLKEYLEAKDRSMNRRDAAFYSAVLGVVLAAWAWGAFLVGGISTLGVVVGVALGACLAFSIYIAMTGRTIFWPRAGWTKTFRRFFARHGVDAGAPRPWGFSCRTSATPDRVEVRVMHDDEAGLVVTKPYKEFSHVEVTEHLVVLVSACDLGPVWKNLFTSDYADRLMEREETEDAVWRKDSIDGMDADQLVEYLSRKVRVRQG